MSPSPASTGFTLRRKQTRTNVHQSKNGCYTCRSRRVKCDETKPSCQRCERTGRECGGYKVRPGVQESKADAGDNYGAQQMNNISANDFSTNIARTKSESTRFSQLGLSLLSCAKDEDEPKVGFYIWDDLLPKLCNSSNAVQAATIALGAAYEGIATPSLSQERSYLLISLPYDVALTSLQRAISLQNENSLALILASLVLGGVEALQRNMTNALTHIRGAFRIYMASMQGSAHGERSVQGLQMTAEQELALGAVIREFDVQIVTYKLSNQLALPTSDLHSDCRSDIGTSLQAEADIVFLLHACYAFCSTAAIYRYRTQSGIPKNIVQSHNHYVSLLEQYLFRAETYRQPPYFRLRCLSALIYLKSILSPYEVTFDFMHHLFQQIVDGAAAVLSRRTTAVPKPEFAFKIISSLAQPLFLTAMKCRGLDLRRTAIDLLAMTGREGPWDSRILVAVAKRAVAIEEGVQYVKEDLENKQTIPEPVRLHGCGMGHISSDTGAPVDGIIRGNGVESEHRVIEFRFRKCTDIERYVRACGQDHNISQDDAEYWEVWDEKIEL